MPDTPTAARRNVRAVIEDSTHQQLALRQSQIQLATQARPQFCDVVALALAEWAAQQAPAR